jgi:hypothetical protein
MKRLFFSILCVAVFFTGLGALVDSVGAKFKSDDKALTLIKQARQAIGGDQAIAGVRGLSIVGKSTRTVRNASGETVDVGEQEIAMQLPDKLMKMVRFGTPGGAAGGEGNKQFEVIVRRGDEGGAPTVKRTVGKDGEVVTENVIGGEPAIKRIIVKDGVVTNEDIVGDPNHKIIIRKGGEGDLPKIASGDGDNVIIRREKMEDHGAMRQNELLRTTLSLLLTAPEGMDVSYTFGGETDLDGTPCNVVNADFGGSTIKLYLSKATSLPVGMSYVGHSMPVMVKIRSADGSAPKKDVMVFTRSAEGGPIGETAEYTVRFSDYRSVGGVQMPYKWTTTVGGDTTDVFDVTTFDVNPPNIAEKFQNEKVMVRMPKENK